MLRLVHPASPRSLRIGDAEPLFVESELRYPRRYPHARVISAPGGDLTIRYRLSGWRHVAGSAEVARMRTLFCWMHLAEERIGALRFQQIDLEWADNAEVFFTLDAQSHELMKLGHVLTTSWDDVSTDVGDYGPILDFQGLWVRHRFARVALWLPAAQHFIRRTLGRHSIMVLQVFPLEFEGRGLGRTVMFERRRRAMIHYYRKLLGAQLLPGQHGRDGWMWAPRPGLEDIVPYPKSPRS
jgi:hypothetical protein